MSSVSLGLALAAAAAVPGAISDVDCPPEAIDAVALRTLVALEAPEVGPITARCRTEGARREPVLVFERAADGRTLPVALGDVPWAHRARTAALALAAWLAEPRPAPDASPRESGGGVLIDAEVPTQPPRRTSGWAIELAALETGWVTGFLVGSRLGVTAEVLSWTTGRTPSVLVLGGSVASHALYGPPRALTGVAFRTDTPANPAVPTALADVTVAARFQIAPDLWLGPRLALGGGVLLPTRAFTGVSQEVVGVGTARLSTE